jgi:hypothetical protein
VQNNGAENEPIFPIQTWNQYDTVVNDGQRTNNAQEGFHNAFASRLSPHPPFSKWISIINKKQKN